MINYLSKFSTRLSELAEPIRDLAKERVPFNWGLEHDEAFGLIKKEITAAPILAYYNPKKPTVLQTDASCKGLGMCILQNKKPVYFASKALTETQKGYVAIETGIPSGSMGNGEIPSLLIRKPIYPRNRPETLGSHTLQKLESSHTTTPKNSNQDISVQLQDKIYSRVNQSNSRLPIHIRGSKRFNIFTQITSKPNNKSTQGSGWQSPQNKASHTSQWQQSHNLEAYYPTWIAQNS